MASLLFGAAIAQLFVFYVRTPLLTRVSFVYTYYNVALDTCQAINIRYHKVVRVVL